MADLLGTDIDEQAAPVKFRDMGDGSWAPIVAIGGPVTTSSAPAGTVGYASGTAATTVTVPAGGQLRYFSVLAGGSAATVQVAGGATVTIPAGQSFDRTLSGNVPTGTTVVIGGGVASYYVEWTT